MRIAVEGCAHGELEKIYETIEGIERSQNIKVDLLLCCGDFQSTRNVQDLQTMAVPKKYLDMCSFYKYYSGELVAPILTIFIGGNHEASNYLQELPYGGWVAPNIYYLGYAGVINVNGIRIAGISGIYKGHDFLRGHFEYPPYTDSTCRSVYHVRQLEVFRLKQLTGQIDIFMSHDWPRGIWEYGNKAQLLRVKPYFKNDIEKNILGSRPLEELMQSLHPLYWFAAHLHCKFAALVPHYAQGDDEPSDDNSTDNGSENDDILEQKTTKAAIGVSKFLALDKCLPKRRFLQVLDMPTAKNSTDGELVLEYDAEWLAILLTTNHLISVSESNYYLPGKNAGDCTERYNFSPTEEELALIHTKLPSLDIPRNFSRTVPAFEANEESNYKRLFINQPEATLNPQNIELCAALGLDDPLSLAMLANGKQPLVASVIEKCHIAESSDKQNTSSNTSDLTATTSAIDSTPQKRKLNFSLPAAKDLDEIVSEIPEEMHVEEALPPPACTDVQKTETVEIDKLFEGQTVSTGLKKFKRRNQNIYQSESNDDGL